MQITASIAVQHGRTCADNDHAAHRDQPSGFSDNAAQGTKTRVCRSACDGQGAAVEGQRVDVIPGKDRVEVLVPVPVPVLILAAEPVPEPDPELAPELIPELIPKLALELIPELAL